MSSYPHLWRTTAHLASNGRSWTVSRQGSSGLPKGQSLSDTPNRPNADNTLTSGSGSAPWDLSLVARLYWVSITPRCTVAPWAQVSPERNERAFLRSDLTHTRCTVSALRYLHRIHRPTVFGGANCASSHPSRKGRAVGRFQSRSGTANDTKKVSCRSLEIILAQRDPSPLTHILRGLFLHPLQRDIQYAIFWRARSSVAWVHQQFPNTLGFAINQYDTG